MSDLGPCLVWDGDLNRDGYGRWGHDLAHRRVWEEEIGDIPDGLTVDHLCGNRACIQTKGPRVNVFGVTMRAGHLELVTQSENSHRRWQKARQQL